MAVPDVVPSQNQFADAPALPEVERLEDKSWLLAWSQGLLCPISFLPGLT
jgi:hypothetical protein